MVYFVFEYDAFRWGNDGSWAREGSFLGDTCEKNLIFYCVQVLLEVIEK
jgi:hypothetical protein